MIDEYDRNHVVKRALAVARELDVLADQAAERCSDDGCSVVCGVIRDCAYKIKGTAEREKSLHRRRGIWTAGCEG
jgi:hypothetical protein